MDFTCPQCKSTNVQRASLIFKQGTSSIQLMSTSLGLGAGGGHLAVGGAETATSGRQQSLLAQQLAPPKKKDQAGGGCLLTIGAALLIFGFLGGEHVMIPLLVIGVPLAVGGFWAMQRASAFNKDEYPRRVATWERSFLCLRCGHSFALDV